MHCSRCKSDFCWKCLLPYKNHKTCKEEVVGDNREVEAEVNTGMSEPKRFQLFQEKFKKVKKDIGYLDTALETENYWRQSKSSAKNIPVFPSMKDIVEALKSEMVMTADLGWFPTDHLARAGNVLEETQRVFMYSQVMFLLR